MWSARLRGRGVCPSSAASSTGIRSSAAVKGQGCVDTGRSPSNPASVLPYECFFLLFCPPRASSSGPWAQRPPPVWPVTVFTAGQRPPHPPSRLFCLLSGEDAASALARFREHHRGSFHQRAMSGDWEGM